MTTLAGPQADFFRASQQIQLYKAKREELLEFLLPSHPKILKLDESIAEQEKIVEVFKRQSLPRWATAAHALALQITQPRGLRLRMGSEGPRRQPQNGGLSTHPPG